MPLCKIRSYKYYKNVTNVIDIVINDCKKFEKYILLDEKEAERHADVQEAL